MIAILCLKALLADIFLDGFVADNNIVFIRIFFELCNNLRRVRHIYYKYAEKQADKKGKSEIAGKPVKRI